MIYSESISVPSFDGQLNWFLLMALSLSLAFSLLRGNTSMNTRCWGWWWWLGPGGGVGGKQERDSGSRDGLRKESRGRSHQKVKSRRSQYTDHWVGAAGMGPPPATAKPSSCPQRWESSKWEWWWRGAEAWSENDAGSKTPLISTCLHTLLVSPGWPLLEQDVAIEGLFCLIQQGICNCCTCYSYNQHLAWLKIIIYTWKKLEENGIFCLLPP